MKYFGTCLVVLVGVAPAAAQGPALKEARKRWLRGDYAEARAKFQKLLKQPKARAAAAVGLSRAWESEGEYAKALSAVDNALKDLPDHPDLLARRAEVLYLRGRWDAADKAAAAALKKNKDHILARWVRAQILRDRGELRKADAEFRWFVRTYTQRSNNDNDIKDAEELVLVGLAGTENARWHSLSDQFDFILKEVYFDALKYDKDYWWAEYHAGMLLLEKHNPGEAEGALQKAASINGSAAEVLVGRGLAALEKLKLKEADSFARRALDVNPRLPDALRLKADIYLAAGDVKKALTFLEKARAVNPRDENTLGRIAACYYLRRDKEKKEFHKLVKQVAEFDSRPGLFYAQLAERLDERRQFDDAEKFYKKAIEKRPMLAAPRAALGMLYMRMGREQEARTVLKEAFKIDAYNVRVSNTLKVLNHLDKYDKIQTKHFLLRYDPKHDKVLARYMAVYLEEIYEKLAKQFNYRPKGPILIEVFNNHHMFSGRIIALPDLYTIGAATGRMFAMVSPRDRARVVKKPFNWARVLRHELVHIFNLEQTNFLVPHWLTEGLAVRNEGFDRPPRWDQILVKRVPDHLLNLDTINMAFIRHRSDEEWQLAYFQSLLYVQYLKAKYKEKSIGKLLDAYRRGLDTTSAIEEVCKTKKADFEKGYRQFVLAEARKVRGKAPAREMTFAALVKAQQAKPDDLDLKARLADKYLTVRKDPQNARQLAEEVLKKKENHGLASYVLASLLEKGGEGAKAIALLEAAVDRANPEPKVVRKLGLYYFAKKKYPEAIDMFQLGRKAEPNRLEWLIRLAQVYGKSENNTERIKVLKKLAPKDPDSLEIRKTLARLLLKAGEWKQAEQYAREALEIDVLDRQAQKALKDALRKQDKADALKKLEQILGEKSKEG
jgi:tetratricopeptide (TPR) repeat protein